MKMEMKKYNIFYQTFAHRTDDWRVDQAAEVITLISSTNDSSEARGAYRAAEKLIAALPSTHHHSIYMENRDGCILFCSSPDSFETRLSVHEIEKRAGRN